jgi:hypothetical protein
LGTWCGSLFRQTVSKCIIFFVLMKDTYIILKPRVGCFVTQILKTNVWRIVNILLYAQKLHLKNPLDSNKSWVYYFILPRLPQFCNFWLILSLVPKDFIFTLNHSRKLRSLDEALKRQQNPSASKHTILTLSGHPQSEFDSW